MKKIIAIALCLSLCSCISRTGAKPTSYYDLDIQTPVVGQNFSFYVENQTPFRQKIAERNKNSAVKLHDKHLWVDYPNNMLERHLKLTFPSSQVNAEKVSIKLIAFEKTQYHALFIADLNYKQTTKRISLKENLPHTSVQGFIKAMNKCFSQLCQEIQALNSNEEIQ